MYSIEYPYVCYNLQFYGSSTIPPKKAAPRKLCNEKEATASLQDKISQTRIVSVCTASYCYVASSTLTCSYSSPATGRWTMSLNTSWNDHGITKNCLGYATQMHLALCRFGSTLGSAIEVYKKQNPKTHRTPDHCKSISAASTRSRYTRSSSEF